MWTPYPIRASFEDEAAGVKVAGHERQAIATDLTLWPSFSQNQTKHGTACNSSSEGVCKSNVASITAR